MVKQILGIALIAVLGIILIVNISIDNKTTSDINDDNTLNSTAEIFAPPEDSGLNVGNIAPDFELQTLEGERLRLSDLRGKKVFLNFWATWCPPCKKEMPEMQEFHDQYGDEVIIVAVNNTDSETSQKDVSNFIEDHEYTFTVLMDDQMITEEYMAISIPTTYFIGTDGVIQQPRRVGPMTYAFMEDMMNELN